MNSDTHSISRRAPPKTCIYIDTHGISNNGRGSGFQMHSSLRWRRSGCVPRGYTAEFRAALRCRRRLASTSSPFVPPLLSLPAPFVPPLSSLPFRPRQASCFGHSSLQPSRQLLRCSRCSPWACVHPASTYGAVPLPSPFLPRAFRPSPPISESLLGCSNPLTAATTPRKHPSTRGAASARACKRGGARVQRRPCGARRRGRGEPPPRA